MYFPILHYKTPLSEEKLKVDNKYYLVNTRIEICIYKLAEDNFCSVISKDIIFNDGYCKTVLLDYISNKKTYDDVFDFTTAKMKKL